VYPGNTETCANGVDDDCDSATFCYWASRGATTVQIDPYPGTQTVASWYRYNNGHGSSANTGLELHNRSIEMLYQEPDGDVHVVIIHDRYNGSGGGNSNMSFTGMFGASVQVRDDSSEGGSVNATTGNGSGTWAWVSCCTDGAAYGPTLASDGCVTLSWNSGAGISGITTYDGTTRVDLGGYGTPVQLCRGQ
jgi:hypothetical protein